MLRLSVIFVLAVSAFVMAPATSSAQNQPVRLSELLPELYFDVIFPQYVAFIDVTNVEPQVKGLVTASHLTELLSDQLSSFPLVSASGGFTWSVDTASGAFTRASDSFGPVFAERALTIGRRRLNVGTNYQHVTFDHLDGRRLAGGDIVSYTGAPNLVGTIGIFFADALDLKVTTDTVSGFATYGVTDRFDIGVAVPINRVAMKASLTSRIGNTRDGVAGSPPTVTSRSGAASGIGDVVVRTKFNILKSNGGGVAEAVDVRLPTGDERNLLGVAGAQVKLALIASSMVGRLSPHLNLGYTISGTSSSVDDPDSTVIAPPEEINYAGGADVALSLRTTVAVDVVGRTLRRVGTLTHGPTVFGPDFPEFQFNSGTNQNLLVGSVGLKVNPFANMLVTANVLFPLSKRGLTDNLTWMAGIDYSF